MLNKRTIIANMKHLRQQQNEIGWVVGHEEVKKFQP